MCYFSVLAPHGVAFVPQIAINFIFLESIETNPDFPAMLFQHLESRDDRAGALASRVGAGRHRDFK